ncbi:tRNA (adenosine(37)-N6)-dimethylallyltransferase MiaA [Blastochloris sulfoviridis]|uniref:tRNA dimethylallyltransferase n=1 Tax=Blastochloris sulfoviridis TaxID=50712 RepID=A0A5M6I4T9_9HYPH|nr:tRNA (adenosine(37)-N6)-dimethylallyltransferase MiaA [Blastochloris sulfoviridis]KAA5603192.1 tRNA (adenosine(37)-N6)-dimethylallyltransferase MiaA [Blastochloris sulfoviridis]
MRPRVVLIAGPTASGKSAVALDVAERLGGTVINADSMQVYRDLRILTARPSPEEMGRAPHLLYGHVDAAVNYSAGRWVEDVTAALSEVQAAGRLPVVVGGTGLYFKALTQGLSDIPAVPDEVRAAVRAEAEGEASADLHARLAARDPVTAARLSPGDRQRVLRALEVLAATGRPLAAWQDEPRRPKLDAAATLGVFLAPERAWLTARIDARFDAMLDAGALAEVAALKARNLDPALPAMRAHGVPGLIAYLTGEISLEAAAQRGKADTRAYAKRQVTWFRHQMPGWRALVPEAAAAAVLEAST